MSDLRSISPADAAMLDRVLSVDAGEAVAGSAEQAARGNQAERGEQAGRGEQAEREDALRRVLSLLDRWEAQDPEVGLADRTVVGVLTADPVALSDEDAAALDALLALRRGGLERGPMPAGSGARAERVSRLLGVLDRMPEQSVPQGLAERTAQAVDRERERERKLAAAASSGFGFAGGVSIRQIAATAALLMVLGSVLLPMLDRGRRDALIAQCGANLAGLGGNLAQTACERVGKTDHLTEYFASREIDGTRIAPSKVNVFVLLDKQNVDRASLECPSAEDRATAYYNGQYTNKNAPDQVLRLFKNGNRPVFADTNPLYRYTIAGLVRNASMPGMTQSGNHEGFGQNVLFTDGSVQWKRRPTVQRAGSDEQDNIWLFQAPKPGQSEPDVFLTP